MNEIKGGGFAYLGESHWCKMSKKIKKHLGE